MVKIIPENIIIPFFHSRKGGKEGDLSEIFEWKILQFQRGCIIIIFGYADMAQLVEQLIRNQ